MDRNLSLTGAEKSPSVRSILAKPEDTVVLYEGIGADLLLVHGMNERKAVWNM